MTGEMFAAAFAGFVVTGRTFDGRSGSGSNPLLLLAFVSIGLSLQGKESCVVGR